jgi:hypothetical protein
VTGTITSTTAGIGARRILGRNHRFWMNDGIEILSVGQCRLALSSANVSATQSAMNVLT